MNTDLRNRVVLPILLPIAILGGIVAVVASFAFIMLFSERSLGLTFTVVAATGLMVAFSLANSLDDDEMTLGRRGVILAVAVLPLLGGVGTTAYSNSNELLVPWDYEPHLVVPATAVIGAQNAESFCTVNEAHDACVEDVSELTMPAQPDSGVFAFTFYNLQGDSTPHNVQLFELAEDGGAPAAGALIFGVAEGSVTIPGGDEVTYQVSPSEQFVEGAQFYYNCVVHPAMEGVLTIGPPEA